MEFNSRFYKVRKKLVTESSHFRSSEVGVFVGNADEMAEEVMSTSVRKLLDALGDEELSAAQIMERLGLSHKPTFRKTTLPPALEQGAIEKTVPRQAQQPQPKVQEKATRSLTDQDTEQDTDQASGA